MRESQFNKFSYKVSSELLHAEMKHPEFCTKFLDPSFNWEEKEKIYKIMNSHSPYYADTILLEEVAEAMSAYQQGNKVHCLQELSQCGAVIFRMMEQVESEIIQERNKNAEKILDELQKE